MAVFDVPCMRGVHKVILNRESGQLGFSDHTVKELWLLKELGESCGCLDVLEAFRAFDHRKLSQREWREWLRDSYRKSCKRADRRKKALADPGCLCERAARETESALIGVREDIKRSGLDVGIPLERVSLYLSLHIHVKGERRRCPRRCSFADPILPSAQFLVTQADDPVRDIKRVKIIFRLRWLLDVGAKGRMFFGRHLVLGWSDERPLVLWLPSESGVAVLGREGAAPKRTALPWADVFLDTRP